MLLRLPRKVCKPSSDQSRLQSRRYKRFGKAALATQLSFVNEGGFVLATSSEEDGHNNPYESLARRAKMPHPLRDAKGPRVETANWLDTRIFIVGE
jgi:hypothetical protein